MANKVIEARAHPSPTSRSKYVRAVALSRGWRVLGASAYHAQGIVASQETYRLIQERGQQDWDSEYGRFPAPCSRMRKAFPGLTWPTADL